MFDQKEYNQAYYKKNKEKIKRDRLNYHHKKQEDPKYRAKRQLKRDLIHFGVPRSIILRKTDNKCYFCGKEAQDIHHLNNDGRHHERLGIKPNHDPSNLVPICKSCHIDMNRANLMAARKTRANGYWSKTYDRCIECGTDTIKHGAKGMCINCRARHRRKISKEGGV